MAATVGLLVASLGVITTAPAGASDASAEDRLVALINQSRRDAGRHGLAVRGDLRGVARRHSARMAKREQLHHNPNRTSEVCCWRKLAENVAYGHDLDGIHSRLMGSSGHRANILSPDYTEVGVGVEVRDGVYWVTQVFRLPDGAPPPEPEPAPRRAPAPAPEPRAAATPARVPTPAPPPPAPPPPSDRLTVMMARIEPLESERSFAQVVAELGDAPP